MGDNQDTHAAPLATGSPPDYGQSVSPVGPPMAGQPIQMTQMPAMPVQHTGPFPPQGQPGQGPYTVQQPVVATGMPPMQQVPSPTGQPGVILVQQGTMPVQPAGQTQPAGHQYQTALPLAALTGSPAPVDCPACGQRALTVTESETGGTTHAWAAILCFCLCLGCIPYMMSSTKDVRHKCSKCGASLATWHRSGRTEVHIHA